MKINFKFKNSTLIYEKVIENVGIISPIEETIIGEEPYFYIKNNHGELLASIDGDDKETLEVERNKFITWVNAGKEKIEVESE